MEILSETTQRVATTPGTIAVLFGVLFIFVFFVLDVCTNRVKTSFAILFVAILLFILGFTVCTEPHRRMKVILQDDYPAVELLEKYDVVEQDGRIWTLDEKEPMRTEKK